MWNYNFNLYSHIVSGEYHSLLNPNEFCLGFMNTTTNGKKK